MKKHFLHGLPVLTLSVSVLLGAAFTSCQTKAGVQEQSTVQDVLAVPALMERKGELAKAEEWAKTREKVAELQLKIVKQQSDVKSRLQLATIYMAEARITGEHPYYYPAILKMLDGILALDANNFEALTYKASVKMSQHQFAEAKEVAEKARNLNPGNAYIYGVLVDANVELGNYEEAVKMSDKMQSLKPSLESYSRASYLREIYGDYPGAIQAMKMAVEAGLPGSEPHCWAKKTLGHLYEKTGKWNDAEQQYQEILALRPSYAFALEGMARVEKNRKQYDKALAVLEQASALMPEFSFEEEKGDIQLLKGEEQKATEYYQKAMKMLEEDEQSGHLSALEKSKLYLKMKQFEKAEQEVMKEYTTRPGNIDVAKELAWISFNLNKMADAKKYIGIASSTGSRDPELLARMSRISSGNPIFGKK